MGMNSKSLGRPAASTFIIAVRFGLGALLVWSGFSKISEPYEFLSILHRYQLVPSKVALLIAVVLPWLELLLGISLSMNLLPLGASVGAAALGVGFLGAQASVLARNLIVPCGCFDMTGGEAVGTMTMIRTGVFLAAAILLSYAELHRGDSESLGVRLTSPAES